MPVIAVIISASFLVLFFWLILKLNAKTIIKSWDAYTILADELKIPLTKPEITLFKYPLPYLSGTYKNHTVNIRCEQRGSGKNRYYINVLTVKVNTTADSSTIRIYREGFFSKIGKSLGMQDIQVGYDEFDKTFILKSSAPDLAAKVFDNKMCDVFINNKHNLQADLIYQNTVIAYSLTGHLNAARAAQYREVTEIAMQLAANIEKHTGR
jgi:hypothetical protein